MGLLKNKHTKDKKQVVKKDRSWKLTTIKENAIKIMDNNSIQNGTVLIPKVLFEYFEIKHKKEGEIHKIILRFMKGNYDCTIEKINDEQALLTFNVDFKKALIGVDESFNRDIEGEGRIYIKFSKRNKNCYDINMGIAHMK